MGKKRKISGLIDATEHPLGMEVAWNQEQPDGKYHAYSGDDIEAFLKDELKKRLKKDEIDKSLDESSTNPVENAAVTKALETIDASMGVELDLQENEGGETLRLSLLNKEKVEISSVDIPKGGDADVSLSRIVVRASVDNSTVKEGGRAKLTYFYDHVSGENISDGVKGNLEITVSRGTTQTFSTIISNVDAGTTGYLDVSPYLLSGTCDIYVKASCMTADGTQQKRQAYASVNVVTLNLTSSFNIAESLLRGGYGSDETISVPFAIVGSGEKVVTLYLDGEQALTKTITRSGTTNEAFLITANGLSSGRHNVQIVAERDGLKSDSIYMDFLVAYSSEHEAVPYIGTKLTFSDGRVYTDNLVPTIDAAQYEQMGFQFVAWNIESNMSRVEVREVSTPQNGAALDLEAVESGRLLAEMSVNRQIQNYVNRFTDYGVKGLVFVCETGGANAGNSGKSYVYPFNVDVKKSDVDIAETGTGLQLKLSAAGRSNGEAEESRANWGDITTFEGFDWKTSGWTGDALRLRNGAKATIGYKPFETDAKANGLTVEVEFQMSNVMDRSGNVISCIDNGRGFNITATEAQFYTGNTKTVIDSDDVEHSVPVGVAMTFASNLLLRVAFVLHTNSTDRTDMGNSLMELFINGVRSKVDQYGGGDYFMQTNAKDIVIDSAFANIDVRNIYVYNRALNEDEVYNNWLANRPTGDEMLAKYAANDVLGEDGNISIDKLKAKGRAVCVIIPASSVDAANAENNKKTDFTASKVLFYSPYGESHDLEVRNCYFRIQGTSSTKYPRKNYRLYLAKGPNSNASEVYVGGELVSGKKYAMRPDSIPMNLFCLKADYSDSAMVMNTGGAKLFDETMKELDLLTPPQRWQKEHEQEITVRQAIDGIPCDLFVADAEGGEMTYYGQYNFNNEKSKSEKLFGMGGVEGFTAECPICLEGLNNGNAFCLFQSAGSADSDELEAQLQASFDDGFEFNYPEDVFYGEKAYTKSDASSKRYINATEKTAVKRLLGWIYECKAETEAWNATTQKADYSDISKWVSEKFVNEIGEHFDVQHLLTYYLFTDYWASVDQRAKNILWRTWDGVKWYATYYDGDTAQGMRNDSFLAYLYNITRDSWDDEAAKYAYEGHDSVLWCMVLANLEDELRTAANNLRNKLTTLKMLEMFNGEQMNNWSERQYNRSGWFKYVAPKIEGVMQKNSQGVQEKVYYNYLYALTGNREAHRTAFLTDRGDLLDARYGTNSYQSDRATLYARRTAAMAEQTVAIKSGDLYYYGYRTNNGVFIDGPKRAEKDEVVELSFTGDMALNDPLNLCGASRMTELDWRRGPSLGGNFEVQACRMLRKINFSNELGAQMQPSLKVAGLASCSQLEEVDLTGQNGISTDGGTTFDLSEQMRLKTFKGAGTGLTSVLFAEGAPVEEVVLPGSVTSLNLKYLPKLTMSGLQVEDYSNVESFNFAACPGLNWVELLDRCVNVEFVRVEGIKGCVSAAYLEQFESLRGIDANGNHVNKACIVGEVWLTDAVSEEKLAELRGHYQELTIHECQWTGVVFDDAVSDPKNITNLDNNTTGIDYTPTRHILSIREKLVPVYGKLNTATGVWEGRRISNENYHLLADGSEFDYSDVTGDYDMMMRIPDCWYKGVNDFKAQKKYIFWSSLDHEPYSTASRINRNQLGDIIIESGKALEPVNGIDWHNMLVDAEGYGVYQIGVGGMKQVRWPAVNDKDDRRKGCVFLNGNGDVIETYISYKDAPQFDFADGDYLFIDVPEGAETFVFTSKTINESLEAIAVDSAEIEAIEPDWVHNEACLGGIYQASYTNNKLRSMSGHTIRVGVAVNSGETLSNTAAWTYDEDGNPTNLPAMSKYTFKDFMNLAARRGAGFQLFDYEMSKFCAILWFSLTGTRDAQLVCGYGKLPGGTTGYKDDLGNHDSVRVNNGGNKCLGFESFFGCTWEVMDNIGVNIRSWEQWKKDKCANNIEADPIDAVYHIYDPIHRTERTVQGTGDTSLCVARVRHGRYCDTIASSFTGDSSVWAANYCDGQYYTAAKGRVVGRSGSYSNAHGGLVYACAVYASSHSYAYYGARLAFRGRISVENDKA